jgi:hypothetical protein
LVKTLLTDPDIRDNLKSVDVRSVLEASLLNTYSFFDMDTKKQSGSKLLQYDDLRAKSPTSYKMMRIDRKYGGKPKVGQLVREGHYPKISDWIDKLEEIAL